MPVALIHWPRPVYAGATLFCLFLVYYGHAALTFPTLFNLDNPNNFAATRYIAKHYKLPVVDAADGKIIFSESGTTRLSRPPFTYIVSAVVFNITEGLVDDETRRLRLASPLLGALTVVVVFSGLWIAFSHLGLALLGAVVVGLLPRFVFLASCNNDDIGAILSVSVLFTGFILLAQYGQKTWVFFFLAFAAGLLLQTKYTAWLTLPWFGIYGLVMLVPAWRKLFRLAPLLLVVCIAAGGWWVVFNMVNYGVSDPSGLRHIESVQSTLFDVEPNRQGYLSRGIGLLDLLRNHDQFLSKSYKSLIGYLEWLNLEVGFGAYLFYGAVFLTGIVGALSWSRQSLKQNRYIEVLALVLVLGQCWFYIQHNALRDVQPQGRYILPVIMPAVYMFLNAIARVPAGFMVLKLPRLEIPFQSVAAVVLMATCLAVFASTMTKYVVPSFEQKPFYTRVKDIQIVHFDTSIKVNATSALDYRVLDKSLTLERAGVGTPTLEFDPGFCDLLPINALVIIGLSSPTRGGFHLRLDRNHAGTYEDVYWHGFPAGQSVAALTLNAANCSGVKLTLGKNTHSLTLQHLQIGELRIHEHGMSI